MTVRYLVVAVALAGCSADVGKCDIERAVNIVFVAPEGAWRPGQAMYEGQAYLATECATCHSHGATGTARGGAPVGLDFELGPLAHPPSANAVEDLSRRRMRVLQVAPLIVDSLRQSAMPPLGSSPRATLVTASAPHPPLAGSDRTEVLRNWLACGAPMVVSSTAPGGTRAPADRCGVIPEVGYCVTGLAPSSPPQPTWEWVRDGLLRSDLCLRCHDGTQQGPQLSFEDELAGLMEPLTAGPCVGRTPVIVGDPEGSLLLAKLEGRAECGAAAMPPSNGAWVGDDVQRALQTWIREVVTSEP